MAGCSQVKYCRESLSYPNWLTEGRLRIVRCLMCAGLVNDQSLWILTCNGFGGWKTGRIYNASAGVAYQSRRNMEIFPFNPCIKKEGSTRIAE